jgi:hypothetical protein
MRMVASGAIQRAIRLGWKGPPFDVEVLASLHDLQVRRADWLTKEQDGCIVHGRPSIIYINDEISTNRARYTIAHEIAHELLREFDPEPGEQRRWKYRHEAQSPVEQLCQVGASELLMPSDAFESAMAGRIESLSIIRELAGAFEVSQEACARNLIDRSSTPCAMIVLQLMNKPSELCDEGQITLPGLDLTAPPKRLRIRYGWTSRSMDECFLPEFKSIPDHSSLYQLVGRALGASNSETTEDWSEVANVGTVSVAGMVVGSTASKPRILCVIRK